MACFCLSQCKDKEHNLYRGGKSQAAGRTKEQEERQRDIICTHQHRCQLCPTQPLWVLLICEHRGLNVERTQEGNGRWKVGKICKCLFTVYHEDVNAPQRHHRHREEPKARPLRVGDTEKPGPEGKRLYTATHCSLEYRSSPVSINSLTLVNLFETLFIQVV